MSKLTGTSTAVQVAVFALIWCAFVVVATYAAIGMFVALAPADLCDPRLTCSKGPTPAVLFASHAVIALVSFAGAAFGFLAVHGMRRTRLAAMQAALDKEMRRSADQARPAVPDRPADELVGSR